MINNSGLIFYRVALILIASVLLNLNARAELKNVSRTGGSGLQFEFKAPADRATVLETSSDLQSWFVVQTNLPGATVQINDAQALNSKHRFYRLGAVRTTSVPQPAPAPTPAVLSDLANTPNSVFAASEFGAVKNAPNGTIGLLVWRGRDLVLRERTAVGSWSEQVVFGGGNLFTPRNYDEHRFQPSATLIYSGNSAPRVLVASGRAIAQYQRNTSGGWSQTGTITPNTGTDGFALFYAQEGPGGALHIAFVNAGSSPAVHYGTDRSGTWNWSRVASISGNPRGWVQQAYSPRFFSMAVDANNNAHLTYTPEFRLTFSSLPGAQPYSELWYASNASGYWQTERVHFPADGTGEAGMGASVAITPDNQPAIASWYSERAATGSGQWSHLLYWRKNASGQWSRTEIVRNPDSYAAGDGPKGTGFAPELKFDAKGRPHILFSDYAAEHFHSGQNEYAGQVRHAWFNGSSWSLRTLYRQAAPLKGQVIYPSFAMNSFGHMSILALDRETTWLPDFRVATSVYRMRYLETSVP